MAYLEKKDLFSEALSFAKGALFLDRDGVIIEDCHYIKSASEVRLEAGARHLIEQASQNNVPVVIVTNQSGIGRGLLTWNDCTNVNKRMLELLGSEKYVAAIYANAHCDQTQKDSWRKPGPGMILEAARDLNIDLNRSVIIGDRESDMLAGINAGIKYLFHVLTGHGMNEKKNVKALFDYALQNHEIIIGLQGNDIESHRSTLDRLMSEMAT